MKSKLQTRPAGWTRIDLLAVLVVVFVSFVLVGLLLPALANAKKKSSHINCVNNLKQVGLAFRLWAQDNGDRFPMFVSATNGGTLELVSSGNVFPHFQVMSNELATCRILICPEDKSRKPATNFASLLSDSQVSYFVGVEAKETNAAMFLTGDCNLTLKGVPLPHGLTSLTTNSVVGWTKEMHKTNGNVVFADGSVQMLTSAKLREALTKTGVAANRLAVP